MVAVLVLAGYLGSGKTTLLNHVLTRSGDRRLGVVVNDFGRVGVDPMLVTGGVSTVYGASGGCLCCVAGDDELPAAMGELERAGVDAVLVEASGLAEPRPLARRLAAIRGVRLAGVVQVVDAAEALSTLTTHPPLARHIAFADVVVVNKVDRARGQAALVAECRRLNPTAAIVTTSHGVVDPDLLLEAPCPREPFTQPLLAHGAVDDSGDPAHRPGGGHAAHLHHGYESAELLTDRPLDATRLLDLLDERPRGVFRIKGMVSVATARGTTERFVVQVVGRDVRLQRARAADDGPTRLVCIGRGMRVDDVRARLAACALRAGESPAAHGALRLRRRATRGLAG